MKNNRSRIGWKMLMVAIGFIMLVYAGVVLPGSISRTPAGYEPGPAYYPMLGVLIGGFVLFVVGLAGLTISFFKSLFSRKSMKDN